MISIALGIAVMEIALSVVEGFQMEVQEKVVGFGSHIQIGNYLSVDTRESEPLPADAPFLPAIRKIPGVASISPYINSYGLLKSEESLEGIGLKGIGKDYDWSFFKRTLKEGRFPAVQDSTISYELLISKRLAEKLKLKTGDKAKVFFIRNPPRARPVVISGIYESGLGEFDDIAVLCDIRMLQRIENWDSTDVSGFEINMWNVKNLLTKRPLQDLSLLERTTMQVNELLPPQYGARSIREIYPEMFDWLELQNQNVWFILLMMVIIAVINMSSVLIILIIERTPTIGLLKAMGATNGLVRNAFLWNAAFLILSGMICGNILGLSLIALQDYFKVITLDQDSYFLTVVPVAWTWGAFAWVNIGLLVVCLIFMMIPAIIISRITPVRAIRFE